MDNRFFDLEINWRTSKSKIDYKKQSPTEVSAGLCYRIQKENYLPTWPIEIIAHLKPI